MARKVRKALCVGLDTQRVNIGRHKVAQCFVDEFVSLDARAVGEGGCGNSDVKMTEATSRARMSGVKVTLVFDKKVFRRKRFLQGCFDHCDAICGHGNTRLNGLTMTLL